VQKLSGAKGPCYAISTACSTGAKALVAARGLLELAICDAVIAGATDSLSRLTANGFHALQAVAREATNPMSANRAGLTLGEASALFLVTREPGGIQLLGAGESSDAHHISAPDPEGRGAEASMREALTDAGLSPHEVAYINLHGTGTPHNDAMESAAIDRVFGKHIPCSSTKPLTGHTLGAAGALEAGICWGLLHRHGERGLALPPHHWDGVRDEALPEIALAKVGDFVTAGRAPVILSNSFGFGGSNCSLILGTSNA
jgi:3-oxoacyl-[acyl-carrier-protein] synthase-1